jgi:hypothetical protein
VLSTLPTIVNAVIEYFAGVFIQRKGKDYETMAKLSNRLIAPTNDFLNLYIDYVKAHESAKRILSFLHPGESEENKIYRKMAV